MAKILNRAWRKTRFRRVINLPSGEDSGPPPLTRRATGGVDTDDGVNTVTHTFSAGGTFALIIPGLLPVSYTITGTGSFDGNTVSGTMDVTTDVTVVVTSGTVEVSYDPADFVSASPIDLVSWVAAFWAEGPEFQALGVSDGATFATWPDEIGAVDLISPSSGAYPTYDADGLAGQPAITYLSGDYQRQTSSMSPAGTATVVICKVATTGSSRWHDNQASGGGGRWVMGTYSGNVWQIYFGTSAGQTVPSNTAAHLFLYYQNGSNDRMEVDGTTIYGPANYGTSTMARLNVNDSGGGGGVTIAFLGVYNGDPDTDPGWADFVAWANDKYGLSAVA